MDTTAALIQALRQIRLLEEGQLDSLQPESFPTAQAMARDLVRRELLTPFQVNRLFQGKGRELLLGSYVLIEELGQGGMGAVYKARNWKLGKVVAVKVISPGRLAVAGAVSRFHREIRAAAQLNHANVVKAFDADEVNGIHFFAMEYVAGVDLAQVVKKQGPLPVAQACEYIRQAALGLQHAFERGLVHRDIKPSNLLLTYGGEPGADAATAPGAQQKGLVKILDMGLARLQQTDEESSSTITREGTVMGTPDYIAPEQARESHDVDIRADLYSLGCTIFFLLTGQPPFPSGTLTQKLLRHQLDPPPVIAELRPDVPRAVAEVVYKLLAKNRDDRYQTPAELAESLALLLEDKADLSSGAPTRLGKVGGDPFTTLQDSRTALLTPEPIRLPVKPQPWLRWAAAAGGVLAFIVVLAIVLRPRGPAPTPEPEPVPKAKLIKFDVLADRGWQDTGLAVVGGQAVKVQVLGAWSKQGEPDCMGHGLKDGSPDRAAWPDLPPRCILGRVDSSEKVFAVGVKERFETPETGRLFVRINDLDTEKTSGKLTLELAGVTPATDPKAAPPPTAVEKLQQAVQDLFDRAKSAKTPDDKIRLEAAALAERHGGTWPARRALLLLTRLPSPLDAVQPEDISEEDRFSEWQPKELAAVIGTHHLRHWQPITCVAFSPRGKWLAAGTGSGYGGGIRIWNTGALREWAFLPHPEKLSDRYYSALAFSPDETRLLALTSAPAAENGRLQRWDLTGGKPRELLPLKDAKAKVQHFAFSPDQHWLAVAFDDKTLRWFDREDQEDVSRRLKLQSPVTALAFVCDGDTLFVGAQDGAIRRWQWKDKLTELDPIAKLSKAIAALAPTPDGKYLATTSRDAKVRIWEVSQSEAKELWSGDIHADYVAPVILSHDARFVISSRPDMGYFWDRTKDPKKRLEFAFNGHGAAMMALSPDGSTAATVYAHGVRLGDMSQGKSPTAKPDSMWHPVQLLASSPDAAELFVATSNIFSQTQARLKDKHWQLPDFRWQARAPDGVIRHLGVEPVSQGYTLRNYAYTPDGQRVATGHFVKNQWETMLWDLAESKPRAVATLKNSALLCFSPDGKSLATHGEGTVQFWEVTGPQPVKRPEKLYHPPPVGSAAYSPDGRYLAIGEVNRPGSVRLWDLAHAQPKEVKLPELFDTHVRVAFSPDSHSLAAAGNNGKVVVWNLPTLSPRHVWRYPGGIRALAFAADGRHLFTGNNNGTVYMLRLADGPG